ncbi:DDE_3 domain-containing protein [Trichonephila clavipes]|nr:DDE_3 domain-containing protein [Trichonephila clavipes]
MVWSGICASDKTSLVFFEEGVKINQKVYQRYILEAAVLPRAQKHFENTNWTFHQDSTSTYKAKKPQEWCKANFPAMILSEEWATLHAGFQSHGLKCMIHFVAQGLD